MRGRSPNGGGGTPQRLKKNGAGDGCYQRQQRNQGRLEAALKHRGTPKMLMRCRGRGSGE